MGDVDKPFACSEPGCGMKFTNEDHLDVHKQKHMMSLALNSNTSGLSNFLFADQTPTPTKFLKNCDDIGLFQELNKNPFEESFKKAASEFSKDQGGGESVDTPTIPQRGDDMRSVMDSPLPGPNLLRTPSITVTDTAVSSVAKTVLEPPVPSVAETLLQPTVTHNKASTVNQVKKESPLASRPTSLPRPITSPLTQASVTTFTETITQSQVGSSSSTPVPQSHIGVTTPVQQPVVPVSPDMTVQVLLTLPGGASIPVQIPATAVVNPFSANNLSPTYVKQHIVNTNVTNSVVPITTVHTIQQSALNLKTNTVTKAAASSSTSAFTKQKLKEALSQNAQNNILKDNMRVMSEAVDQVTSGHSPSPSEASTPDNTVGTTSIMAVKRRSLSTTSETDSIDDGDPDAKRQRFLARNRAAAQRCRDKRKNWITNLEAKAEDLTSHNTRLQNEVRTLREEVAKLKTILLEHKDCPITLEQQARGDLPGMLVPAGGSLATNTAVSTSNPTNTVAKHCAVTTAPLARIVTMPSKKNIRQKILLLPQKTEDMNIVPKK